MSFRLPLKIQSTRIQQQKKHFENINTTNIDNLVEENEKNIEIEFLQLFDYTRCNFNFAINL